MTTNRNEEERRQERELEKTSILSINFNVIFLVSNPEIIKKPKNLKKNNNKKKKRQKKLSSCDLTRFHFMFEVFKST